MLRKNVMFMLDPPQPLRLEGALAFARAHNWQVTIASRLLRPPAGWLGDGILVTLRNNMQTTRFVRNALKKGIPVVDLTHHRPDFRVPRVTPDYADTGRTAVRHLKKVGCRSILYFSTEWTHVRQLEYEGIRKACPPVEKVILSDAVPLQRLDDEALRLLAENPLQPPSVDQLAACLKISRSTFDRLFRRELGQSLHDFVLERRLVEAKRLLLDGALPVAEVSRRCGFCNPGHFISTFKRATGRTPASFAADYQSRPANFTRSPSGRTSTPHANGRDA